MASKMIDFVRRVNLGVIYRLKLTISFISKAIDFAYLRYYGVDTKFGYVTLMGFPLVHKTPGSTIKIGKNVTLVSSLKYNIAGINHPVVLATLSSNAIIDIDEGSGVSGSVLCAVNSITIGKHVGLGANSKIFDTDFHPLGPYKRWKQTSILDAKSKPISIADYVWIGEGALILKGVAIGRGTVIGARAVLNSSTGDFVIFAGNPAIFLRDVVNDFPGLFE